MGGVTTIKLLLLELSGPCLMTVDVLSSVNALPTFRWRASSILRLADCMNVEVGILTALCIVYCIV